MALLREDLMSLREDSDSARADADTLRHALAQSQKQVAEREEAYAALSAQFIELRNECKTTTAQLRQASLDLEEARADNATLSVTATTALQVCVFGNHAYFLQKIIMEISSVPTQCV